MIYDMIYLTAIW